MQPWHSGPSNGPQAPISVWEARVCMTADSRRRGRSRLTPSPARWPQNNSTTAQPRSPCRDPDPPVTTVPGLACMTLGARARTSATVCIRRSSVLHAVRRRWMSHTWTGHAHRCDRPPPFCSRAPSGRTVVFYRRLARGAAPSVFGQLFQQALIAAVQGHLPSLAATPLPPRCPLHATPASQCGHNVLS